MTGLLFLGVVALWFFAAKWLAQRIGNLLPDRPWRVVAKVLIFALLLPLPLIDEIVGGWQFNRLCEANVVRVNKETARGKTVYVSISSSIKLPATWINVRKMSFSYIDRHTGEVVAAFDQLHAEGGHLFPGFDSGHDPLTFKGECHPPGAFDKGFAASLGLTEVEKP
jgi:putative copper export protein